MTNKRGQLTIFIIIAILVVAGVAMFFILRGSAKDKPSGNVDVEPVYNYVQECMEDLGEKTLYEIAKNGGYADSDKNYYLIRGENNMPSKENVEEEISEYFNRNFYTCSEGYVDFSDYEIQEERIETEAIILEDKIKFNINYPLTVIKGDSYSRVTEFKFEFPSRLNLVYDYVAEFISEQEKNPDFFCLTCVPDEISEKEIFAEVIGEGNDLTFYFIDQTSELNGETFKWVFINKY
jgi:hypothetical protein